MDLSADDAASITVGLKTLYEGPSPEIDIIAVHGLGANPDWAWVRKIPRNNSSAESNRDDTENFKRVNWLADLDMLPSKIPNSRILTFNYLSRWHRDAPAQRRALCGEEMLESIHTIRKETPQTEFRPLIFIGHSFGGIVIEQALVLAESNSELRHIAISTIGVISLGTPFRGSDATDWANYIARTGSMLGLGSSTSITQDLSKESTELADLRYHFTLWLFRRSVPVYCFFEQYKTDYGKRVSGGWSWKAMVVDETSATLDGHKKIPLPTDHLLINKFDGPRDPSYAKIVAKVLDIYNGQKLRVVQRLNPRSLAKDYTSVDAKDVECMRHLYLTDPRDDLASIKRAKGERVSETCEWLLTREEYTRWTVEDQARTLYLVGDPGIGKTMLASFLVDELAERAKTNHQITFAYYFCDNKDQDRRLATAVLRGILLQILRQHPPLMRLVRPEYDLKAEKLFQNFDALSLILKNLLENPETGETYLLIDALDECEKDSQKDILRFLSTISSTEYKVKVLVTSRPIQAVVDICHSSEHAERSDLTDLIRIDSAAINNDLFRFIENAVDNLPRRFPPSTKAMIKTALEEKIGGTFLWASLVLEDIAKVRLVKEVPSKLSTLPRDLNEIYTRILDEIEESLVEDARCILRCVVAAIRPLTVHELAVAWMIGQGYWEGVGMPTVEDTLPYLDGWQCCGHILRLDSDSLTEDDSTDTEDDSTDTEDDSTDTEDDSTDHGTGGTSRTDTVKFIHQSVNDFLVGTGSTIISSEARFHFHLPEAHLFMFGLCMDYISKPSLDDLNSRYYRWQDESCVQEGHRDYLDLMLRYSCSFWQGHAIAAEPRTQEVLSWLLQKWATKRPSQIHRWLGTAAEHGQIEVVKYILSCGIDPNVSTEDHMHNAALHLAAEAGKLNIIEMLLSHPEIDADCTNFWGSTPFHLAAKAGQLSVMEVLSNSPKVTATIRALDRYERTALHSAKHSVIPFLLRQEGIDVNALDRFRRTPIAFAVMRGDEVTTKLLLARSDVIADREDYAGRTPLSLAAGAGREACMILLLTRSDVAADHKDHKGRTPLSLAAGAGREACVALLLARSDVSADHEDHAGRTPLSLAAEAGREACVALLLARSDVAADSRDNLGRTSLSYAATIHDTRCCRLLLSCNDVDPGSVDVHGRTPLSHAAEKHRLEAIQLLLARTDLVDTEDNSGRTAISWVLGHCSINPWEWDIENWTAILDALLAAGAKIDHSSVVHEYHDLREFCGGLVVDTLDVFSEEPLWKTVLTDIDRVLAAKGAAFVDRELSQHKLRSMSKES